MARKLISYDLASKALVGIGFSRLARSWRAGEGCVLTFHGVRSLTSRPLILDEDLHTPVCMFRSVCRHLAENYNVLPLCEMAASMRKHGAVPPRAIALTFDDGYESNYKLAFPVLKEFRLPATIFLTTGFLDGTEKLWFNRLELAVETTEEKAVDVEFGGTHYHMPLHTKEDKADALRVLLSAVKAQPQDQLLSLVDHIKRSLGVGPIGYENYPDPLLPLKWDQVREMRDCGLIDFGGHTQRHPILGRCTEQHAREEIFHSRDRIVAELGRQPTQFAYTNGKETDFTSVTQSLLREAGYQAAYTMIPGFIKGDSDLYALPRYGTPSSVAQAEVTVSGTFEALHNIKQVYKETFAA